MLNYLIKPTKYEKNKWVISRKDLSRKDVRHIILNSRFFISDLDDSIANSPTKAFVKKNFFKNPRTIPWAIVSLFRIVKNGRKNRYSKVWCDYFKKFKGNPEKVEKAMERLYPGIYEFFSYLEKNCPSQKQILVTRTNESIGMPYQALLGFEKGFYNQFYKHKVIDKLIKFCEPRMITIAGDSEEDQMMVEAGKRKDLEYCLGINVAKNKRKINEEFDINIGRDWRGLQEIITANY